MMKAKELTVGLDYHYNPATDWQRWDDYKAAKVVIVSTDAWVHPKAHGSRPEPRQAYKGEQGGVLVDLYRRNPHRKDGEPEFRVIRTVVAARYIRGRMAEVMEIRERAEAERERAYRIQAEREQARKRNEVTIRVAARTIGVKVNPDLRPGTEMRGTVIVDVAHFQAMAAALAAQGWTFEQS